MITSRNKKLGALAVGLSCLLAGWALAQQYTPPVQPGVGTPSRPGESTLGTASPDVDRYLANCWAGHNKASIELSQIAQKEARDPKVKEFAEKMVQEHSDLSRKLQPLASAQGTGPASPAINQLIAIDKQITERTTDSFKQKLEEKSGAEFDQCYIGGQVACHIQASAALDVISRQASGPLKQLASETKKAVDEHLTQAEQIAKQLMERQAGGQQAATGVFRDRNLQPAGAQQ